MTLFAAIATLATMAASAVLQASIGFGFAIFSIPLLVLLGWTVPEAIALAGAGMTVQMVAGLLRLGQHISLRPLLPWIALTLISFTVGLLALKVVAQRQPQLLEAMVGGGVLVAVLLQGAVGKRPTVDVGPGWTAVAMVSSGLLNGATGMGGPPLIIWAVAHPWEPARVRATIWAMILPRMPLQILLLYLAFGQPTVRATLLGLVAAPAILGGSALGLMLGARLSGEGLRRISLVVLTAVGVYTVIKALLG